jgi:hypothetical protein
MASRFHQIQQLPEISAETVQFLVGIDWFGENDYACGPVTKKKRTKCKPI